MIATYRPCLGAEELRAVQAVFESRWLGCGPTTERFEQRLAEYFGCKHVIALGHGTDALHLALDALELAPGDEVIVPSLTFAATIQAILMCGASPVFCEVEPDTLNLDVRDAEKRITPRTRVILPVHFAGLPCDMNRLFEMAKARHIRIVEDAAHAFGSLYQGRPVGTLGDLTCFSFDSIKNITCGEGGAVATDDAGWARRIAQRRRLGIDTRFTPRGPEEAQWQYHVVSHGFRQHMSDINAAIGLVQLDRFPEFQRRRREIVARYDAAFLQIQTVQPLRHDLTSTCPWAYVLKVSAGRRDSFREFLARRGVNTLVQFIPNHLQPAFEAFRCELPITERLFSEIVSLPLHVELSDADVAAVIEAVESFAKEPLKRTPGRQPQPAER